ncbi:MAG: response regulator [Methanoregula sp.]|nr:response regulator [Methanoregula sp.]
MDKKNVLIVEDDPIIQHLIQICLKNLGYEVCGTAGTGDEAVASAQKTKPDFVLMDINLSGKIDGIDAARQIKAQSDARIIFLTAFSDEQIIERAKEIHPAGFILKPFSNNDLRITLELAK